MMKRLYLLSLCLLFITGLVAQNLVQRQVRMAVVLPLKEHNTRGNKMVEFYQGILMAVDSIKREGVSVDVQAIHSGSTASEMDQLLFSQKLKDCDVVFGPLDAVQLTSLADYCDLHHIHLVVPFSNTTSQVTGHPYHYLVNAPRQKAHEEAIWYIQNQFADSNIILVQCNEQNAEGSAFGEMLRTAMSAQGIYVRPLNLEADDTAFQQAFNAQRRNLIVLNSTSMKALNQILPKLKDFKRQNPDYQMSLFGYPTWQTFTSQLLSDFYELDTYLFTSFYRNPLANRNEAMDRQFMSWFHKPMSNTFPRYALMGFDLGYFFLRGIALYGSDHFQEHVTQVPVVPFQHPFYFEHTGEGNGYINAFVQLIHYTPHQSIELISRNR